MPAQNIIERSFTGGEIAPALYARTDHIKYSTGLRTCRNMFAMRHGGVTQRPGTQFIGQTLNSRMQVRLIPFIFNETGLGQSYILEFGNQYIAFYQNGGYIIRSSASITGITQAAPGVFTAPGHGFSNGAIITISGVIGMTQLNNLNFIVQNVTTNTFTLTNLIAQPINTNNGNFSPYFSGGIASQIYTIASPYLQADLSTLRFAESADVLTIVHKNYAVRELKRVSPTNWTLTQITNWGSNVNAPTKGGSFIGISGTPGSDFNLAYQVTSVNALGAESDSNSFAFALANEVNVGFKAPTNATPITLSWDAVPGAVSYRIYVTTQVPAGSGALAIFYGFIGQTTDTKFIDTGITPDFTNTYPQYVQIFGNDGSGNCPSFVGFSQQRRYFGNTINNPIGFWGSQPGLYSNFDTHITTQDSDAIIGTIAGEEVNAIQAVLEQKFMVMLTTGAEIYVQGNGQGVVTPSAINASVQSQYGCSTLRPLKVGDVILFNQALGNFIRDLSFDFVIDGYRGNDITVFSAHLFEGHQIVDWAYQKVPDSIIWAVRDDGVLLSCTYIREQQILAWARHDFQDGFVENVSAIPENGEYAVYLSILRQVPGAINNSPARYIERIASRIWSDPILVTNPAALVTNYPNGDPLFASYLDCFSYYYGVNATELGMTVGFPSPPSGGFSTDSTAYQQQLTLAANSPYFTSQMVGDQIFIDDALFRSSQGQQGNQIRLTIQSVTSSTRAVVTPDKAVPQEFQSGAIGTWAHAIKTVTGLGFLEGKQVSVWADRFLVGSPLNNHIDGVYTVTNGSITLDKCYSIIYVGLPMIMDFETLQIDTTFGDSLLDQPKDISHVIVYLYNARGFFGGTQNPDTDPDNTANDALFNLLEYKGQGDRITYDQPPGVLTDAQYMNVDCNWSKEGRIFIRNVDPIPLSILAVIPAGLTAGQASWSQRV